MTDTEHLFPSTFWMVGRWALRLQRGPEDAGASLPKAPVSLCGSWLLAHSITLAEGRQPSQAGELALWLGALMSALSQAWLREALDSISGCWGF